MADGTLHGIYEIWKHTAILSRLASTLASSAGGCMCGRAEFTGAKLAFISQRSNRRREFLAGSHRCLDGLAALYPQLAQPFVAKLFWRHARGLFESHAEAIGAL